MIASRGNSVHIFQFTAWSGSYPFAWRCKSLSRDLTDYLSDLLFFYPTFLTCTYISHVFVRKNAQGSTKLSYLILTIFIGCASIIYLLIAWKIACLQVVAKYSKIMLKMQYFFFAVFFFLAILILQCSLLKLYYSDWNFSGKILGVGSEAFVLCLVFLPFCFLKCVQLF